MSTHLSKEIERLKKRLLFLGAVVEESMRKSVSAAERRDAEAARDVIANDEQIDQLEVEIEEECLKILALHQPVAIDLRFIVAVLKINDNLERIGDLAVNIAERAEFLAATQPAKVRLDFVGMAEKAQMMLKRSLDALVNSDSALAKCVCLSDDEVDAINRQMIDAVKTAIRKYPEDVECLIHLLSLSRHLERTADLATNIAEDVIYMVDGEIVRHRTEDYTPKSARSANG